MTFKGHPDDGWTGARRWSDRALMSVMLAVLVLGAAVRVAIHGRPWTADLLGEALGMVAAAGPLALAACWLSRREGVAAASPDDAERPDARREFEFESFPAQTYLDMLRDAKRSVWILDTYPAFFADSPLKGEFLQRIREALTRGVQVRVVVTDAEASVVEARASSLGGLVSLTDYRHRIDGYLRELYILRQRLPAALQDRLAVHLVDSFPGIACYGCDDALLTSSYPRVRRAAETHHVLVSSTSDPGSLVLRQFQDLEAAGVDFLDRMTCAVKIYADSGDHAYRQLEYVRVGTAFYALLSTDAEDLPTDILDAAADVVWTEVAGRLSLKCVIGVAGTEEWQQWLGTQFQEKYGEIRMARELMRCRLVPRY